MIHNAIHTEFRGPLRVHASNPRYFTDDGGKAVYLTGSHTWENLQDFFFGEKTGFDYDHYLNVMQENNHNFMRMWIWEQAAWMPGTEDKLVCDPLPFARSGPEPALDGRPKFDLDRWNEAFFERLRSRVIEAGRRGIYVSVMLFEGWSVRKPWVVGDPWKGHPFHASNNVNGVDGDIDGDGDADIHCLENPAVVAYQEKFVRKIVDTVNDLDNVLYEIINETSEKDRTVDWQVHMIDFIHDYESGKPKQHPVGMTPAGNPLEATVLFNGRADWISPNYTIDVAYRNDPPASDGKKVILSDTDHLGDQVKIDYQWVWKSFLRGIHPIFMDPWDVPSFEDVDTSTPGFQARVQLIRRNMGYSLNYANRIRLAAALPSGELVSTGYCLSDSVSEFLVFLPEGGSAEVDLSGAEGEFAAEWFDPVRGVTSEGAAVTGGGMPHFDSPFDEGAILYLYAK